MPDLFDDPEEHVAALEAAKADGRIPLKLQERIIALAGVRSAIFTLSEEERRAGVCVQVGPEAPRGIVIPEELPRDVTQAESPLGLNTDR